MSGAEQRTSAPIAPRSALTGTDRDARTVLVVWLVRRSFLWLLWLGLAVAALVTGSSTVEADLDTPGSFWSGLASPIAVLVIAVLVRIGAGIAGLLATYPLVRAHDAEFADESRGSRSVSAWADRLYLARAYAALRSTYAVRLFATRRLGAAGAHFTRADRVVGIANIAGFFVMVAALFAAPAF